MACTRFGCEKKHDRQPAIGMFVTVILAFVVGGCLATRPYRLKRYRENEGSLRGTECRGGALTVKGPLLPHPHPRQLARAPAKTGASLLGWHSFA